MTLSLELRRRRSARVLNGHWTVLLDVTANDGTTASQAQDLPFRDALVASLGDSAASGEGNPDRSKANGSFSDPRCDRSSHAASQIATDETAARLGPHATVTLWNLACSGASITYAGDRSGEGGLLTPYDGQNWTAKTAKCCHSPLPPQVDQLKSLLAASGRTLDSLLITAGANDTGWASMAEDCYWRNKLGIPTCEQLYGPIIAQNLKALPARFNQLAVGLAPLVPANRVYLNEYWDATHDDRHETRDPVAGDGFSWFCPRDVLAPNAVDRRWGYEHGVVPLNAAVHAAATAHPGYHLIGGIADEFRNHGLCATNSWIVSPTESLTNQGNVNGGWHANLTGLTDIANHYISAGAFDFADEANARAHTEGSFVRTPNGGIYRIIGGTPIWVASCQPLNGCPDVVSIPNLSGDRQAAHQGHQGRRLQEGRARDGLQAPGRRPGALAALQRPRARRRRARRRDVQGWDQGH